MDIGRTTNWPTGEEAQREQPEKLVEEALANAISMADALAAPEMVERIENRRESESTEDQKVLAPFTKLQKARCHWIQLAKLDLQHSVIQQTFVYVFEDFEHLRPLWRFGKHHRKEALYSDPNFHDHCSYFQTALTLIMECVDDPNEMAKFARDIGARHFFYDVFEPHSKVICNSMMKALRAISDGEMDTEQAKCWHVFFKRIETSFNNGLSMQRQNYLRKCFTAEEMGILIDVWDRIRVRYMEEDGNLSKCSALMYKALKDYCHKAPKTIRHKSKLEEIANATINAVNEMIEAYDSISGFAFLPDILKSYCYLCSTVTENPRILRLAFSEGFANIMSNTLDDDVLNAEVKQVWCKVTRVLQQIIEDFIVSN